ncbi:MAG: hypothetical protein ABI193_01245 [Minicystis sp.]
MLTTFLLCSLVWTYGGLSILFAFREVPPPLRFFFPLRLPLIAGLLLVFVPEQHHVNAARITIGGIFLLGAVFGVLRALYHFFYGWA